jgi:hypothetical protein
MLRRLHSAAALAVVGFVAAGCGGGSPTPPPLITTAVTSTSTPSATSSPSVSASPATGTAAGANAASASERTAASKVLTGFLGGLSGAATAKSSAALEPFYSASCLWCADQTKSIDLAAFLNGSRTGGEVSATSVRYRGVGKQKQLVFDVTMSVSAMKVVDRFGHKQLSSPAVSHGAFTFGVARSGSSWVVVDGSPGRNSL